MKSIFVIVGSLLIQGICVKAYRTFSSDIEASSFCMYKEHFIISPMSTCCNMSVVEPGINLKEQWEKCAVSQSGENAQQAAWEVYSCAVKASNGDEGTITLTKFAELMSAKYPEEIKAKIIEQAGTVGGVEADLSDSKALDKLRVTYYDLEREACRETPSDTKEYGKARQCKVWEEDIHRGGRCCDKSSFPFDIGFNSFMGQDLSSDSCSTQLQPLLSKFANFSVMAESSIMEICDLSCELIAKRMLDLDALDDRGYFNIDFKSVAAKLLPQWLPPSVQQEAVNFALQKFVINSTIERMREYEFADNVGGNSSTESHVHYSAFVNVTNYTRSNGEMGNATDFMRRKFSNNVVHIPINCAAHKELLAFMELYLHTKKCSGSESTDESSQTEKEAETTDAPAE